MGRFSHKTPSYLPLFSPYNLPIYMKRSIAKVLFPVLNTRAAGLYILLFALAIGVATFIENDFGKYELTFFRTHKGVEVQRKLIFKKHFIASEEYATFKDFYLNPGLSASAFAFSPPKGTDIVNE